MIEFDIGGRQIGKTTRLLQWLEEGEHEKELRLFVAHTQEEANRVARLADEKNFKITVSQFVGLDSLKYLRGSPAVLGVDNLDLLLARLFCGFPVRRVTATGVNITKGGDLGDRED